LFCIVKEIAFKKIGYSVKGPFLGKPVGLATQEIFTQRNLFFSKANHWRIGPPANWIIGRLDWTGEKGLAPEIKVLKVRLGTNLI